MGFGDKFKDLAKQAQVTVAEHKEQITAAVDRATVVADQRTGGKYADKIAKVGQKAGHVVEKLSGDRDPDREPTASGQETPGAADDPAVGHARDTAAQPPPVATNPPDFE